MKFVRYLPVLLLAGCMSYGSWLDDIGKRPNPPLAMENEEAVQLFAQAARLRGEAEAIRVRLAGERDRRQRFRYYEELQQIGDQLVPVESRLRDAGRPARTLAPKPASA